MCGKKWELTMPYYEEIAICGKTIEISKKHSLRTVNKKIPRSKNKNSTPEDVRKVNERNAERNLRRLINTNFKYQDIHLVLTYKKENRPETPQEAKKDLEKFLRKLRGYFKKRNKELKYITVTEYKNKAVHHHLVINSMDTRDLTNLWTHGQPRPTYLDSSGQYGQLASYLIKETSKTFNTEERVYGKRWCPSRNLEQPEVKKRIISANNWQKDPKPKKGYYIEADSKRSGTHELTGYPYQEYRMIKIPDSNDEDEKGKRRK
jgi:hypothetical protein